MNVSVRHETAYAYRADVHGSYNEVRLLPPPGFGQRIVSAELEVDPPGRVHEYRDYFGNRVAYIEVRRPHRRLVIAATLAVETGLGRLPPQDGRPPAEFLLPGRLTQIDEVTRRGLADLPGGSPAALMRAVHGALRYHAGLTDTSTDVNQAVRLGAGVCQDFAHVFVSACRLRDLPARYVGGYLLQHGPDAPHTSHAWAEVFEDGRWQGYDPTNAIPVDERFVRVTSGRDYADVPPVRGVFVGRDPGGMQVRLEVSADQ